MPVVSVIVPCRNERPFIGGCLDSIVGTTYPKDRLEILVADGLSDDGTREILLDYAAAHSCIRLLDNPGRITPTALNTGIGRARGSVIMRMDVHADYPADYIGKLVDSLEQSGADNVGGVADTCPGARSALATAIALALAHPLGVGNSHFRIGAREARWVDTVPFGCYRREVFERIGLFDEELARNQDDEFNARLIRHGGRILLDPAVHFRYYGRDSLRKLWRMFFQYGYFKPLVIRKLGGVATIRQVVPALFLTTLALVAVLGIRLPSMRVLCAGILGAYAALVSACSLAVACRRRSAASLLVGIVFPVLHAAYGTGFLSGVLKFLVLPSRSPARRPAVPLNR